MTLAESEMQTASSRIWTRDTDSLFYNDKRYTKYVSWKK